MRSQIQVKPQIQKVIERCDFLTSSVYERYDLRGVISPHEKVVIRQGDLLVTNYLIPYHNERGLNRAHLRDHGKYLTFRESHIIIPANENIILFHNEHGLVVIPIPFERLHFYTFRDSYD